MTITNFIRPKPLRKNSTVGILSTARAIVPNELTKAIELLNQRNINVLLGKSIGARENQLAGSDALRLTDFQSMLDNDAIDAIICARGGYGTARFLDKIDWTKFRSNPKWILGYSDITALHNTLSSLGIMSLHGIMPVNVTEAESASAFNAAIDILMGKKQFEIQLPEHKLNTPTPTQGILTGGNLSMLYSLRGTPHDIEPSGKILFIEDLDEYLYHIDRMMVNLRLGSVFSKISGLVVGGMTDMNDNTIPFGQEAEEIIKSQVPADLPLFFGASFGHMKKNLPIVCGATAKITKNNNGYTLTYLL
ncbi:MAG: LD-carboxypeptidase [Salinivirgaceae bacterium]|jgi:muramoyltetrapeptide carboxypeptidase|nr:LD-carboxypeptidase [Salinivirgaceae bacterium]